MLSNRRGNFAMVAAGLAPILLAAAAGTVDLIGYTSKKSILQQAADGAALAAVREAGLKGWTEEVAKAVAEAHLQAQLAEDEKQYYRVSANIDTATRKISISVAQDHYPYFLASLMPSPQIAVSAAATAAGSTNVCVIGLDAGRSSTIGLNDNATLSAPKCAVYSNSAATDGLAANKKSVLTADLACTSGGFTGTANNYNGSSPLTDCPSLDDPLASRPAPVVSTSCDETNYTAKGEGTFEVLYPGVYCGGMNIKAEAVVDLKPGVYIIKDGPLTLAANASMTGKGVGFFFTGKGASFSLESNSSVSLEASTTGPLAGLIFFQEHGAAEADFLLRSNNASNLLGTIYLPNGNFIIDTNSNVADASAYTAIVARTLTLMRKPNVVLNTNYSSTPVPVPTGLGPQSGSPRLVK